MEFDKIKYQEYFAKKHNTEPSSIEIYDIGRTSDGKVKVRYKNTSEKRIERIRRVTGYLSDTCRWNDAKQAEERDRIKHI